LLVPIGITAHLGWMLVKKKDILVCLVCRAVSEPGRKRTKA